MNNSFAYAVAAGVLVLGFAMPASAQISGGRGGFSSTTTSTLSSATCTVKSVDTSASTFDCGGKTYDVTSTTVITINGTQSTLDALQGGMQVTVMYSSSGSTLVASTVTTK